MPIAGDPDASARVRVGPATLTLHPFRAAFWEEAGALLLADLHLGKARHFRRAGIPVPQGVSDANWDRLISLFLDFRPSRAIFLGDLFHSDYNAEWEHLEAFVRQFAAVRFDLVRGNHDILPAARYHDLGLGLRAEPWLEGPFAFSHHPMETVPDGYYNLAGHLHPSVTLRGKGRQARRLPCFFFRPRSGILPAFGAFTGHARLKARKGDRVFVVGDGAVVEV